MLTSIEKDDGETPPTHGMPERDRTTTIAFTRGPTPNAVNATDREMRDDDDGNEREDGRRRRQGQREWRGP
jgi:hypothetical protein